MLSKKEKEEMRNMKAYISEFIGTFVLVLFGCGSMVAANFLVGAMGFMLPLGITTLISAVAFGVTMAMLYGIFEKVSGCHLNPAVSFAVLLDGGFDKISRFVGYLVAQFLGAAAAIGGIWLMTGQTSTLGQTGYEALSPLYLGMGPVIAVEFVISFIFVLAFLNAKDSAKTTAGRGAFIGTALTAVYIFGIPFNGGGANPARSFAPAIYALGDAIKQSPIFIVIPLIAAAVAAVVYKSVIKNEPLRKSEEERKKAKAEKRAKKEADKKIKEEMKGKKAGTLGEFGNNANGTEQVEK